MAKMTMWNSESPNINPKEEVCPLEMKTMFGSLDIPGSP